MLLQKVIWVKVAYLPNVPRPIFYSVQDTILLLKDDPIMIKLGLEWIEGNRHLIDFAPINEIEWKVSKGWIVSDGRYQNWFIDGKTFKPNQVFEAYVGGKISKATGGYETLLPQKQVFRVVE